MSDSPLQYILNKDEWDYFHQCEREGIAMSAIAHRLAIELECLVMDTKDLSVQSKWWATSMAAISDWHEMWDKEQPHVSGFGKD